MDKSNCSEYYINGEANEDMNIMVEKNKTDTTKRKLSRLSKRIKESFHKNQGDIDISNFKTHIDSHVITQTIHLFLIVKFNKEQTIHKVSLIIEDKMTVAELVKIGIVLFNKILANSDCFFLLDEKKSSECSLRRSKKNGKPDTDVPALNQDVTVMTTGIDKFTLVYNNNDLIKLRDDKISNSFYKCKKCSIL